MSAILEAESISAGYGDVVVLSNVSLHVNEGEIVVVLGSNGAGKSTTMRTLVGELPIRSGHVRWKGAERNWPLYKLAADGLGYVPEERSVISSLTVAENLIIGRGSLRQATDHFPELQAHLKRKAGLLSGGQQQMVALARILAASPEALVLDELSQGLAPLLVQRLLVAVKAAADSGVAVLLVEQQARLALDVAHRGYILRRGEIVMEASGDEMRRNFDRLKDMYLGGRYALSGAGEDTA